MKRQYLTKADIPDEPGVYTFRDASRKPLYIGRATSLRDRTKSYFSADLIETRGPRIVDMVTRARSLTWEQTDSVLEAIILESELIRKYQPFYNVDERDDKSSQYVVITDEEWPRVFLARARDFDQTREAASPAAGVTGALPYRVKRYFGPYPHGGLIKEALKILRRLFPFKDKKALDPRHDAFYRAIGRSPDGSDSESHARYLKTIRYLVLFFEGRKKRIHSRLRSEMKAQIKSLEFEKAAETNKLIYALDHINDIALIKEDKGLDGNGFGSDGAGRARDFRIEAYDIAHLSGMETVGTMVVSVNGDLDKNEYRKFKISRNANDDIAGLAETLSRRLNHTEWTYPDMIAVDGNETHVSHAEAILKARRIAIPVVGVTKDDRHKAARLIGNPELLKRYEKEIVALNAEAHRFAIAYHRLRRRKHFVR